MTESADCGNLPPASDKLLNNKSDRGRLHTVCEITDCPNMAECFTNRSCLFMILGNMCTRNCGFCGAQHGRPAEINLNEACEVASRAKQQGMENIVLSSFTRDDLPDGGAGQFGAVIRSIQAEIPEAVIEVLISDFKGSNESLLEVINAAPDVINHSIQTVPRLYPLLRPQSLYSRSIELLRRVNENGKGIWSKSGLMLGLGESRDEVEAVMEDLSAAGCKILTLGQYFRPSSQQIPVVRYAHADEFKQLEKIAYEMGFMQVAARARIRSSYNSISAINQIRKERRKMDGND